MEPVSAGIPQQHQSPHATSHIAANINTVPFLVLCRNYDRRLAACCELCYRAVLFGKLDGTYHTRIVAVDAANDYCYFIGVERGHFKGIMS